MITTDTSHADDPDREACFEPAFEIGPHLPSRASCYASGDLRGPRGCPGASRASKKREGPSWGPRRACLPRARSSGLRRAVRDFLLLLLRSEGPSGLGEPSRRPQPIGHVARSKMHVDNHAAFEMRFILIKESLGSSYLLGSKRHCREGNSSGSSLEVSRTSTNGLTWLPRTKLDPRGPANQVSRPLPAIPTCLGSRSSFRQDPSNYQDSKFEVKDRRYSWLEDQGCTGLAEMFLIT